MSSLKCVTFSVEVQRGWEEGGFVVPVLRPAGDPRDAARQGGFGAAERGSWALVRQDLVGLRSCETVAV